MKVRIILPVLLFCMSSNLYAESKSLLTEGKVGEHHFKLSNDAEFCQLSVSSAEQEPRTLSLQSKPPCYFFGNEDHSSILSYPYLKEGVEHVLLIGGTPIDPTSPEAQARKLPMNSVCTNDIQGVTIEGGMVKLGKRDDKAFACDVHRLDEKAYNQVVLEERESFDVLHAAQKKLAEKEAAASENSPTKVEEEPTLLDKIKGLFN